MNENLIIKSSRFTDRYAWFVFALYVILVGITGLAHEPWGDELETWDLIKGSGTLSSLLANVRYDGHPALWYLILFFLAKISHSLAVIKLLAFVTACISAFIFLFYCPLSLKLRIAVLCGYYFLFEYAVFSRNYAIAILLAFSICVVLKSNLKFRTLFYYILLLFLANSHHLAIGLVFSFHLFFLMSLKDKNRSSKTLLVHFFIGGLVLISGFLYHYSASSGLTASTLNPFANWHKGHLVISAQAPLRAFVSIPSCWNFNFWNTNVIWEVCKNNGILKYSALLFSGILALLAAGILSKSRKAVLFYGITLIYILFIATFAPIVNARYVGFIYIGFLISLWLCWEDLSLDLFRKRLLYFFLLLQIPGSIIALTREWSADFSQIYKVKELVSHVPDEDMLITDYWGLNFLSAALDKEFYCVESKKAKSFKTFDRASFAPLSNPYRYTEGTQFFLENNNRSAVFFVCIMGPAELNKTDTKFNKTFKIQLMDAKMGSIEKFSNLYLYKITPRKISL